jgi:hypothetical protein
MRSTPHFQPTLHKHIPQHNQRIRNDIRNTHPQRRPARIIDHILEHHHADTSRKSSSHRSKAHEKHDSRFPRNAIPAVAETITGKASLVYAVDDDHAEGREDAGNPIHEGEVEDGAVEGGFGVAGSIDEDEEGDGELWSFLLAGVEKTIAGAGAVSHTRPPAR